MPPLLSGRFLLYWNFFIVLLNFGLYLIDQKHSGRILKRPIFPRSVLRPLYVYLSFGILHIAVTIHEGSTAPLPNREWLFVGSTFTSVMVKFKIFWPLERVHFSKAKGFLNKESLRSIWRNSEHFRDYHDIFSPGCVSKCVKTWPVSQLL